MLRGADQKFGHYGKFYSMAQYTCRLYRHRDMAIHELPTWPTVYIQGGPKKQSPSDIAITQPKINIFISHFQGLKRRYFDTRSPNFIKK